jgi:hypothetical protein
VCEHDADLPDEDEPDDEQPEWDEDELAEMARELSWGDDADLDADPLLASDESAVTPGERVLYAFGQLHRLHRSGKLPVPPRALAVEDVARLVGAAGELEFSTEDRLGYHFHFPTQVLTVSPDEEEPFPWRLLDSWEWAAEQMLNSFWAEGWE